MGADGDRAGERGQRRIVGASAAPARRGFVHRFSFQSGRTKNSGKLRLRQRRERIRLQRWYIEKGMSIEQLEREGDRWEKWLRDLGRK